MIATVVKAEWRQSATGRVYLALRCELEQDIIFINFTPHSPWALQELARQTRVPMVHKPIGVYSFSAEKLVGKILSVEERSPYEYRGRFWRQFVLRHRPELVKVRQRITREAQRRAEKRAMNPDHFFTRPNLFKRMMDHIGLHIHTWIFYRTGPKGFRRYRRRCACGAKQLLVDTSSPAIGLESSWMDV